MNSNTIDSFVFIIRSVGERTEELLFKRLKQNFPNNEVIIINEVPFAKSIETTFMRAIASRKEWAVVFDADIIVNFNGLKSLLNRTHNLSDEIFEVQGLVFDKFFGKFRYAGNHIYRVAQLEKAFQYIPDSYNEIRPETYIIKKMNNAGYKQLLFNDKIGLHDFEQYYIDIIRKNFVHGSKHIEHIDTLITSYKDKSKDLDFQVGLLGITVQQGFNEKVLIDKNLQFSEFKQILSKNSFVEKEPIIPDLFDEKVLLNKYISSKLESLFKPVVSFIKRFL